MKPASKTITAAQSRAARHHLGLSQAEAIKQSGLPGHKLKQFESGRFIPDLPFLQKLAEFYEGEGVDLAEVDVSDPPAAPAPAPEPVVKPGSDKVRPAHRPHFYISDSVSPKLLDACLERMYENDERVNEILGKDLRQGLLSAFHEQTATEHQEIFGALAENYLIFRLLQGSPLVTPVDGKVNAKTHAQLLGQYYAKSPVSLLAEIDEAADDLVEAVTK